VDTTGTARLPAPPERVFAEVADLGTYPQWLGIVRAVDPDGEAWVVELGARVGPLRRTKRVRMARTVHQPPERVRFERAELDGRPHSPWVLEAVVTPAGADGSLVAMHLHYGGSKWLPGLDVVLHQEVRRAGGRLAARMGAPPV
jgi:uncharacterized protein YndB with AHSA1/START domain